MMAKRRRIESRYVDQGTHYMLIVDDEPVKCVSCGKPLQFVKDDSGFPGLQNHHCSEEHERRREAANKRKRRRRRKTYDDRLSDGCDLMGLGGDDYLS